MSGDVLGLQIFAHAKWHVLIPSHLGAISMRLLVLSFMQKMVHFFVHFLSVFFVNSANAVLNQT